MNHTPAELRDHLRYDPETGELWWKRPWKRRVLTKRAGNYDAEGNRWSIFLFGKRYLQHRVIWAIVTGAWPINTIDHKDGDSSNNKWENLREATLSEQQQNTKVRKDSKWGRNVSYDKSCNCFRVTVEVNGVRQTERHASYGDALKRAEELREELHPNRRNTV